MKIRSKLQTWYLGMVIFVLLALITLSISISLQMEDLFIDYRISVDTIGIEQAEETFNLLNSTARDIVLKSHSSPATTLLSLAPSLEKVSPVFIRSIQRMQDMVLPFIHSINVIHVPTGRLITSDQGWVTVEGDLIEDIRKAYPSLPLLTPLPLKVQLPPNKKEELVFAYLFQDTAYKDNGLSRGVILIVDSQWFLDAVSGSNDDRTATKFLLYHPGFGILGDALGVEENRMISRHVGFNIEEKPLNGSFKLNINSVENLLDYNKLGTSGIYLLRVRDESIFKTEINLFRLKISGIVIVFLVVVILGVMIINRQVYKPFFSTVDEIRESIGKRLSIPDNDLDLLNALYNNLRDEYSESGENRIINNCLRSLSQEDVENKDELIEVLKKRGITVSKEKPGYLCLLSIDEVDDEFELQGSEKSTSYTAIKYQFINGIKEVLTELRLSSVEIFLRRGVILLLLYKSESGMVPNKAGISVLHKMIAQIMETPVTLVQSDLIIDLHDLRLYSLDLSQNLSRRYLLGRGLYLETEESHSTPNEEDIDEITQLRKAIIRKITEDMELPEELTIYLKTLKLMSVPIVQDEINAFSLFLTRSLSNRDSSFQTQELFKNLINQPTLDDFQNMVESFAKEHEGTFQKRESRHSILVNKARDMVEKNYSDPAMCMTSIADELKMSPTYFGMIFKKNVGTPFSDYLTMVRIQEAARLLKTTRRSVQEIMISVGIQSESTFFRRFREIFNMTPQLFRQQSLLSSEDS